MLCCLRIGVCFNAFFLSDLNSEYIDASFYSQCNFWSLSNKYTHRDVPIQPSEIHLHSMVSTEPFKPLSNVNLGGFWISVTLNKTLHTVLTKAAVYASLNCIGYKSCLKWILLAQSPSTHKKRGCSSLCHRCRSLVWGYSRQATIGSCF